MEDIILALGLVTLLHLIYTLIEFKLGSKKINLLFQQKTLNKSLPSVSIILSALNEEKIIEQTVKCLLKLDYPHLEIIAINDRSSDQTPYILEKLKSKYLQLQVYHIDKLPVGWLGKNHALNFAAQKASGDWLLFTDADVIMKPLILKKAMSYCLENQIDHLTINEPHVRHRFWLKVLMLGCYTTYCMVMKPWRIRYSWSKKYLGHGAFNLVRKTAYTQSGGHAAIAMECLDDLMLGKLLKKNGFKQDIVDGTELIEREWYSSAKEMVNGLNKNSFAFFDFNLLRVTRDFSLALIYYIWPLVAVFICSGLSRWIYICNILLTYFLVISIAKQFRLHAGFALLYPISICMLLYTIWLSVYSTYKNNGIFWRDTHYSLATLRAKKPAYLQEK